MGLEYGPAHRGLESVAVGHDGSGRPEVLARVVLPGCVAATREQYVLHPSVLDCALQGLIGLSLDAQTGSERTYLPFAVEEVRVWSACADCGWAWVRLSAGGSLADAVRKVDVDVCDEQGAVCVRLSGFSVVAVSLETKATLLWRPEWRVQAATETEACGYGAHWVVLCDPLQAHAAAIEGSLPGVRCIKLESGERGAAERYAAVASAVIGLLREIVQGRPKASVLVQIVSGVEDEAGLFAGLSGALRTAQLENPHIIGQVIGVEAGEAVSGLVAKLRENALGPIDHQVCYRGGERQVLGWSELPSLTGAAPWRDGGVYLITGGAGGLGLIFARAIAASVKAPVLVLTGRSELSAEKQGELEALEELGARLEYRRVDVSDGASVAALVSEICATYGGVSGVVHSAGVIRDSLIVNKSEAEVAAVLSPKVAGLIALDEATRDVALEFMILFGSGSGAFGNVGQADYAAANGFMAAYAVHRNELVSRGLRRGRTLSIDWPLWRDGGMRVDAATEQAMRSRGVVALDASVGVQALYDAWATGLDQVLVMSGDVRRLRADVMRPSKSVSSRTNSSSSSVTSSASTGSSGDLIERVQRALLHAVSAQLKITVGNIAIDKDLSEYGLDSVGITQLTNHLNERYRLELSPTVVFEHPTPDKLARHLVERHGDVLAAQFAPSRIAAPMAAEDYVAEVGRAEPARPQRRGRISRGAVRSERQEPARRDTEAVAVIGMSGSFPMAPDIDAFWRNLMEGRDCISEIPPERWDWREVYGDPAVQAGKTNVKHGGFIAGVDEFDPLFFGISPREAELMDPQQRLLMTHVWKAIEDAGYAAGTLSGSRTAIFAGIGSGEYAAIGAQSRIEIDGYAATGVVPSVGPNRMSYLLNLHGPSEPVETACSSSLVAIHRALQVLADDSCEMAIVGGVNTLLTPDPFVGFSKAGMLSVDGRCKTFAKDANGYARGEGVGILVLKKLSAAEAAGDHIYGVIRGSAENHGGRAQSLTAPNPKAQAEVVKAAFRRAGIGPRTVSYIEAHGTGTPLGDPIEIEGLKSAFRDLSDASRAAASAYCGIGSVKTNVGHLELAAGVAGVIKVLLQLKHRTLVKSLHSEELNPYIQLEGSPFYVVQETRPWEALTDEGGRALPRRAGVSSFGFGGVNAHVVIEEYVGPARPTVTVAPAAIVLSAKNEARLRERAEQLVAAINARLLTDADLGDVAFTLQVGREAMEARLGLLAGSMAEVLRKLQAYLAGEEGIEDFYRGEVKRNKEALTVLAADDDMAQTIEAWVAKGKYGKLLDLWVKGLTFDWRGLYGDRLPRRISLPTYPFARERYWVSAAPSGTAPAQVAAGVGALHPLVHRNTSDLWGQRFSSTFRGDEFFLSDHVVGGARVLPGVAYLELARAAVEHSAGEEAAGGVLLKHVVWARPLVAGESGLEVHVALYPEDDGELGYAIYDAVVDEAGEPVIHGQGRAVLAHPGERPVLDVSALAGRCGERVVSGEDCYGAFRGMGLEYGPAHRGLESVAVGHDGSGRPEVLARVVLPGCVAATREQYVLHPSVLDCALQGLIGLSLDAQTGSERTYLPFAVEEVRVWSACADCGWAWVRLSAGGSL